MASPHDFCLRLGAVTPFRTVDGVPTAIWTYELSWESDSWRSLAGIDRPGDPGTRIGVELSRRIPILDPTRFPDEPAIQDTHVARPTAGDVQYVYRDLTATGSPCELRFVAPAEPDAFCAVKLVHQPAVGLPWSDLAFRVRDQGETAHQQVISGPAAVCPPAAPPTNGGGPIEGATRRLEKGTLVPLVVDVPTWSTDTIGAMVKFGYVRQLALQPGDVAAARDRIDAGGGTTSGTTSGGTTLGRSLGTPPAAGLWELLAAFEGTPMPSQLPSPRLFGHVAAGTLHQVGTTIEALRREAVDQGGEAAVVAAPVLTAPATSYGAEPLGRAAITAYRAPRTPSYTAVATTPVEALGARLYLLHLATIANRGFQFYSDQSRVGMLNLERLEMTPAGIERGELIATIPLAPLEETAVVQKEWSVTTKEFTSIVTDSLEQVSETGVTDNTELAQSTSSQLQHGNQFNITGTVSGGIPLISGSVTSGFAAQDQASQSATDSRKHAETVTQKASSRSKQEHKVTISTTTVTGTSESTTRTLKNPSPTDPIRIDYFSMMRRWRVRLYRYGLRLTYDVVIPEPGATLREIYVALESARNDLAKPFTFPVTYDQITEQSYQALASQYGAQVPSPKPAFVTRAVGGPIEGLPQNDGDSGWRMFQIPFTVDEDYELDDVTLEVMLSNVGSHRNFYVLGSGQSEDLEGGHPNRTVDLTAFNGFLRGARGAQTLTCFEQFASVGAAVFTLRLKWTDDARAQWVGSVYGALYTAAQTAYYAAQQAAAQRAQAVQAQIDGVDTLTLRREESDEIMKGVLRFLLGPGFEFMPTEVLVAITQSGADVSHGVGFTGNSLPLDARGFSLVSQDEERVRFINQAIEWENVVSFLYSYFWDVPPSWDFIRQIRHADATRQAFLRAGSARVVLTIRKGWEDRWARFLETGDPGGVTDSPYLTIAQEIAAYDDRNYPGIPPANPARRAVRLEEAVYTTSVAALSPSASPVTIAVESSSGFLVGAQVVIGARVDLDRTTDVDRQEAQTITAIGDGTHITVGGLDHPHGGDGAPFPVVQPGTKGALIAEWNEYTPTSGTDIAVTSNLATVA